MIPLTPAVSWLLLAGIFLAGWNFAKALTRWLYEDGRDDLVSLDRHHGARAACSRVGQAATPVAQPRASSACPADQPYDWEFDV